MKNQAAVALGRLGGLIGGKSASAKKQAAARQNGCKGGRPKEAVVVCLSTLKAYYASTLGELHVHGKQVGGLNGRGIVYVAQRRGIVGWLLLRQNKSASCIVRLVAKNWNREIGKALLRTVLCNHQKVYALLDDLDTAEYLKLYDGTLHEVSRHEIAAPSLFEVPQNFDWAESSCLALLESNPEMHTKLIDSSEALKIHIRDGGIPSSPEQVREKLKNVNRAAKQFWLLRPRTIMRYEH